MKTSKKLLAILLTIATLIGIFSCATTVFAEDLNEYAENKVYQESLLTETVETEEEKAEIVCEVTEKRDEYSKTYKRADGSYTSIISKIPLHTYEDGQWQEIDDSVEIQEDLIENSGASTYSLRTPTVALPDFDDTIIEDTAITKGISDGDENKNFSNSIEGYILDNAIGHSEVLVKLNEAIFEPFKEAGITVTDVNYYCSGCFMGGNVLVKAINGNWNSETITYNDVYSEGSSISYEDTVIDYYTGITFTNNPEAKTVYFNITDLFNGWLTGARDNYGFVLTAEDEYTQGLIYLAGDYTPANTTFEFNTFCSIDYVDTSCSNDSFEYFTQEIGRAGQANVNIFSRSLSVSRYDISMDGLRMPVSVGFNYSPAITTFFNFYKTILALAGEEIDFDLLYGKNWCPSYLQYIVEFVDGQFQFFTEEGTLVTFNQSEETVEERDENGNITTTTEIIFEADETSDGGYTLELIDQADGTSFENLRVINPRGESLYFNYMGLVTEIHEAEPNFDGSYDKISITFDEENPFKINYITDGIGRVYDFVYDSETGLLSEIKCLTAEGNPIKAMTNTGNLIVTYDYNSKGELIRAMGLDDEIVRYYYEDGNLYKIKNIDGYTIKYTYDNLSKIINIAEYSEHTIGNTIALAQLSNRQVKVVDGYNGTETYQFGRDGKLNYTFDEKGNYLKSDYAPAKDEKVFSSNDWKIVSQNLLKNGGFEETNNGKAKDWNNSFNVEDVESSESVTDYACKIFSTKETSILQSQTVDVDGGDAYTFSFFAKANKGIESGKLYAEINIEDSEGQGETAYRQFSVMEDFKQYSVTIKKDRISEISKVTVTFGLKNKSGHFYVNNTQLEIGLGTAEYNLVENGSFTNNGEYWSETIIETDSINGEAVNAVKLSGGLPSYNDSELTDHFSATTQNVRINGKKGDIYSVGGWFKGVFDDNYIYENVPTQYTELAEQLTSSSAQIKVTYSYTDSVTETAEDGTTTTTEQTLTENFAVDFAPHNHGWQYAVDSFALKGDTESVDVTIIAKNIPEASFATGVSLEMDSESEIIEDDDAETDSGDEEEICSCGCEECYYGENCPCTGAINNDCQCPECLRKETSTQDNFGNTLSNKSTDGINYIETFSQYTSDGNNISSYTDENGNTVTYDYDLLNSVLKSVTSPMGTEDETTTTNYSYDYMGKVVSVSTTTNQSEYQTLNYVYTYDRLTEIITPNGKYKIIYNDWGQVLSVNVVTGSGESENVIPLVEYTYNEGVNRTQVKTTTYKNSSENIASYRYEYYDNGTLQKVFLNEEEIHYIEYDNLGVLTSIKNIGGRTVEYTDDGTNIYNAEDDCIYSTHTDDDGSVIEESYGVTYKTYAPESDYDSATGISKGTEKIEIDSINRITQETQTDYFGRTISESKSVYNIINETEETPATFIGKIETEYGYAVWENGKTSSTIEKLVNKTYNNYGSSPVYDGYYYEYDKQNKISAEKTLNEDGTTTDKYSYEYDKLGQLVRFNDAVENKTYTYTYDNNGNILAKSEYEYTLADELGTATNITNFAYENQWKDKLTTVGDKSITYDNIGNPINYLGATLTWEGRQLKSYENDEKFVTYEYDENGMRYRTTVVDKTAEEETINNVDYVWLGEKLVSMLITTNQTTLSAKYLYNSSDEVIGFKWVDGTTDKFTCYYLKNLQGDITGIVSATGIMQISYTYDAWGNRTSQYHSDISTITGFLDRIDQIYIQLLSPFGYRGYCLDSYTELYYLQSRYYDPDTGRFINADDTNYLNATGTVLGCNLFAYCENDPVNNVDPRGTIAANIIGAVIGAIIGIVGGTFLGNWLADRLGLSGKGRTAFVVGVAALVGAGAGTIGYFVGPYVAKAWNYVGAKLAGLMKGSFKGIGQIPTSKMTNKINVSKHLWGKVLGKNVTSTNIKSLIYKTIRSGTWKIQSDGIIRIVLMHKGEFIVVTGNIVNGIFKIGDAWVWNGSGKLWGY